MFSIVAVIFVSANDLEVTTPDFGSVERVVSYIGLLIMGWFFWKRETSRTDRSIDDLKAENALLKRDIKELEKDIRALLENRAHPTDGRRGHRRTPDLVEDYEEGDNG